MPIYVGTTKVKPLGISKIFVGNQLVYQKAAPVVDEDYLCFTADPTGGNSWFAPQIRGAWDGDLQYSFNKRT